MHSRSIPFPPAAERAFGSRKGHASFPDGARSAFSKAPYTPSTPSTLSRSSPGVVTLNTTEEMFPSLSQVTQKHAATPKLNFADLVRKRAVEDEAEKARADAIAEAREHERRRMERDRVQLSAISNIRSTFQKTRTHAAAGNEEEEAEAEAEEFYDEGEAYIRQEDVAEEEEEDAYSA